jgi:predicted PurR-regulated permease PerM
MSDIKKYLSDKSLKRCAILAGLAFILLAFRVAGPVFIPFLIAALLAYLSNPLVLRLEKFGCSRGFAVSIVFIFTFSILVTLILISIPMLQNQISVLISSIPNFVSTALAKINKLLTYFGAETINADELQKLASEHIAKPEGAVWIWQATLKSSSRIIEFAVQLILIPFVTFYFLRDWNGYVKKYNKLINHLHSDAKRLIGKCEGALKAFFKGQMMVITAMSLFYMISLTFAGLKAGIAIGLLMGMLTIVPYIGSIIGLAIACIAAVAQTGDWFPLVWVVVAYSIGHIAENFYFSPKFIGNKLGISPVMIIMVVFIGGYVFGTWGLILAIPLASVTTILLQEV